MNTRKLSTYVKRADVLDESAHRPKFYNCGICDCYHAIEWDGDCREDAARSHFDELDGEYGICGWEEVSMPGGEK